MKSFMLFLMFLTLGATAYTQNDVDSSKFINLEDPDLYLPDYLENVYIGMPLAEFEEIKDTTSDYISEKVYDMWFGINEIADDQSIENIVYKFDREEKGVNVERPLYQIEIKYLDTDDENNFLNDKFGDPLIIDSNGVETWEFSTNKDYKLIIKRKNGLVEIYAPMRGTEWDTNQNQ